MKHRELSVNLSCHPTLDYLFPLSMQPGFFCSNITDCFDLLAGVDVDDMAGLFNKVLDNVV